MLVGDNSGTLSACGARSLRSQIAAKFTRGHAPWVEAARFLPVSHAQGSRSCAPLSDHADGRPRLVHPCHVTAPRGGDGGDLTGSDRGAACGRQLDADPLVAVRPEGHAPAGRRAHGRGDVAGPVEVARTSGVEADRAGSWSAAADREGNSNSDAAPTAVPSTSTTKVTGSSCASLSAACASRASNRFLVSGAGAHGFRSSQVSRSAAMLNKTSRSSSVRVRSYGVGRSGIGSTVTLDRAISTPLGLTLIGHSTIRGHSDSYLHAHRSPFRTF